jgi:hypothetical protein
MHPRRYRQDKFHVRMIPSAYSGEVDLLFRRNVTGDSAESAL